MSTILGVMNSRSLAERSLTEKMLARTARPDTDRQNFWISSGTALGHTNSSSAPESLEETQPLLCERSKLTVVFDGRLDNREELLSLLDPFPEDKESVSDTRIILNSYQKWGKDCAMRLLGDFAFAVWDEKAQTLFLARDFFGVRPLYYYEKDPLFVFCSEISPFFAHPAISKNPNEDRIFQFLIGEFTEQESTFFENIQQLPPAHFLFLAKGKPPVTQRYRSLELPSLHYKKEEDYFSRYQELFLNAVRTRLRSTAPVGISLSGGLDSTQIAASVGYLKKLGDHGLPSLKGFTYLLGGFPQEEWDTLKQLQETYQTDIDFLTFEQTQSLFELYLESGDTPHMDGLPCVPFLMERARTAGCKVLLTGQGANELGFSSEWGYLQDLLLSLRLPSFFGESKRMAAASNGQTQEVLQTVFTECLREILPSGLKVLKRKRFIRRLSWLKASGRNVRLERERSFSSLSRERPYRELTSPSFVLALNQMASAGAKYGLDFSHPFLDLNLLQYILAVPVELRMAGPYRKTFAQRAMKGIVPGPLREKETEAVLIPDLDREERRKLEAERLKVHFRSEMSIYQYVEKDIIKNFLALPQENFGGYLPFLWKLIRLELWLKEFFPAGSGNKEVSHERHRGYLSAEQPS